MISDVNRRILNILGEKLLDWYEALSYALLDVDINYEDEEARGQVEGVYAEIGEFLQKRRIDPIGEMFKRGALEEV